MDDSLHNSESSESKEARGLRANIKWTYLAIAGGMALLYGGVALRQSLLCGATVGLGAFVGTFMVLAMCAAAGRRGGL